MVAYLGWTNIVDTTHTQFVIVCLVHCTMFGTLCTGVYGKQRGIHICSIYVFELYIERQSFFFVYINIYTCNTDPVLIYTCIKLTI